MMKSKILILLLTFLPICLFSQNSYLIPDIGAPGMNVYTEIIAEVDETNYFGSDGFYLNNDNSEIRVVPVSNQSLVEVGPLIVSWNGRLISTQIFVSPNARPTSESDIPEFRVELEVQINGNRLSSYNFWVVRPQSLGNNGDISGVTSQTFGSGDLGFRSRKGAIIVDSLIFDGRTYNVATTDTDDNFEGNQGYLPFILLSKGPIKGNGSTISVNADRKNGGPGGGGGGGRFDDSGIFSNGTGSDGGGGFTGGGKGGNNSNNIPGRSNFYTDPGEGTGPNGSSLNGITLTDPSVGWEAAPGGTGHPFGSTGQHNTDGTIDNTTGGYGGGSGYTNDGPGGAGGYATKGDSRGNVNGGTGGKVHGNSVAVPIAGGSGGASGNPNGVGVSSGEGGGGGGASRIFGSEISNIILTANGADGQNGNGSADGGSGSGGLASIFAKETMSDIELQSIPGEIFNRPGGAGRTRLDGPIGSSFSNFEPADASFHRGLSTDTTMFVKKIFRMTGTGNRGEEIRFFIKPAGDVWQPFGTFTPNFNPGWNLQFDITAFDVDTLYFAAVQDVENPSGGEYDYVPSEILSQAAANILILDGPDILCPEDTSFAVTNCPGALLRDSIPIWSVGGKDLQVFVRDNWVFGDRGFTVTNPGNYSVPSNIELVDENTFWINIEFRPQEGQTGTITDTLLVAHNGTKDTCRIAISVDIEDIDIEILNSNLTSEIDTLRLDTVCVNNISEKSFWIRNSGDIDLSNITMQIENQDPNADNDFIIQPQNVNTITVGSDERFTVSFNDMDGNVFPNGVGARVIISSDNCPTPIDTLELFVVVENVRLTLNPDTLDYGTIAVGDTRELSTIMINEGSSTALVTIPPNVGAPFNFVRSEPPLPVRLEPANQVPGAQIEFFYEYAPQNENSHLDSSDIQSDAVDNPFSCEAESRVYLIGSSTESSIRFPDTLDFGVRYECLVDTIQRAVIRNDNDFTIFFDDVEIEGADADYFRVIDTVESVNASPGSNFYNVEFFDDGDITPGIKYAYFVLNYEPGQAEPDTVFLKGEIDIFDISVIPDPADFGDIPVNFESAPLEITLTNNGKLPRTINAINVSGILQDFPGNPVIPGGGSETFNITATPVNVGPFTETVDITFLPCNNSIEFDAIGNGVEGKLEIFGDLNFGVHHPCAFLNRDLILKNEGDFELLIDSAVVEFEGNINTLADPLDYTLTPDDSIIVTVNIDLNNYEGFGTKTGVLTLYVNENGNQRTYPVVISVDVRSGIIFEPEPLDFGDVLVGDIEAQTVIVRKDPEAYWDLDFTIDNQNFSDPVFTSNDEGNYPINNANTNQDIEIEFSPILEQLYNGNLEVIIQINNTCIFSDTLDLLGNGITGSTVRLWLPNLQATPNIDNYTIPVYAQILDNSDTLENVQFSFKLSWNKTMFYPSAIAGNTGQFKYRETDNNNTNVAIETNPTTLFMNDTVMIAELTGPTMLGNAKITDIIIDSVSSSTPTVGTIVFADGLLDLQVCEADGDRLLNYSDPISFNYSETVGGLIEINMNLIEKGNHKVILSDINGNTTVLGEIKRTINSKNRYTLKLDKNNYSSGVYYLILRTPVRTKSLPLLIIK